MWKIVALTCVYVGLCWAAPGPIPWQFVHPEAQFLAGIDWQQVLISDLGQNLLREADGSGIRQVPGFHLIQKIDRLLISGSAGRQPNAIAVVVEGNFTVAEVRQLAVADGALTERFQGIELLAPPKGDSSNLRVALIRDGVLFFGDLGSVWKVLGNRQRQPQFASLARAADLAAQYTIWATGALPPETMGQNMKDVQGLDFGITVRNGIDLAVDLKTRTPEAAGALAGMIQMLLGMASQQQREPAIRELLQKLDVRTELSSVRIRFSVDGNQFQQAFSGVRTAWGARPSKTLGQLALLGDMQQMAPPRPPRPKVVRILGLEEGVREVRLEPK